MNEDNKKIITDTLILSGIAIVDYHYTSSVLNALLFGLFYNFTRDYFSVVEEEKENPGAFDSDVEKVGYFKFYTIYLIVTLMTISLELFPIALLLGLSEYFK